MTNPPILAKKPERQAPQPHLQSKPSKIPTVQRPKPGLAGS